MPKEFPSYITPKIASPEVVTCELEGHIGLEIFCLAHIVKLPLYLLTKKTNSCEMSQKYLDF